MTKSEDFIVRVAVGNPQSSQSADFRIWSPRNKSDVYCGVRDIAGEIKISLHESGECSAGLTSQFALQEKDAVANMGGSRHQSQWTRSKPVGSSFIVPLEITIPSSELKDWREQSVKKSSKIKWLKPPENGRSIVISCAFSGPFLEDDKWPGRSIGTQLIDSKLLANNEKLWVYWRDRSTSLDEKKVLSEARLKMKWQDMVPFSQFTDHSQPPPPRLLIFQELATYGMLVLYDVAYPNEVL